MERSIRRLPDAELEVMQALWRCEPPAGRQDIETLLSETHPMAQTTVLTLLSRLAERGMVTVTREGRRSLYTPAVSREAYLAAQSRTFFEKLCGGSVSAFAAALCQSQGIQDMAQADQDPSACAALRKNKILIHI